MTNKNGKEIEECKEKGVYKKKEVVRKPLF